MTFWVEIIEPQHDEIAFSFKLISNQKIRFTSILPLATDNIMELGASGNVKWLMENFSSIGKKKKTVKMTTMDHEGQKEWP